MRAHAIATRSRRSRRGTSQDGYAMAALLVAMSVMAVFMAVAMPVWNTQAQREKEAELVFRGEQYARAVMLYQRKFANALPPSLDLLLNDRYLRKKYKDPITGRDFQLLSGASAQANAGVPGGQVAGSRVPGGATSGSTVPGGRATTGGTTGTTGTTGAFGRSDTQTTTGGAGSRGTTGSSPGGFGLGSGVGFGAGGSVPGGIMGVTSTSTAKSLRLYNGRGAYNEWTFVPVQRNLAAGGGAQGANTPGGTGRGAQGRGSQTPGRGGEPFRPGGGTGGPGSSPFRPPTGTFGTPQGR
jgi:type II secretory pathway pseudopilin PulG